MKTTYKIIIAVLGFFLFITVGIYSGLIGGGSYEYAQQYEFNATDSVLIKAIEKLKIENPGFQVPKTYDLPDFHDKYKYHFYLNYSDENKLIHCFIMTADGSNKSSIYLDGINDGLTLQNWKIINRDYDRSENLKVKNEFKKYVLNKLKLSYEDKGNGSFIFWK